MSGADGTVVYTVADISGDLAASELVLFYFIWLAFLRYRF